MSLDNERVNLLIQRIYDAALDDALWPSLVRDLAQILKAEETLMFSPRLAADKQFSVFSPHEHIDMAMWDIYDAYFWQRDIWALESARQGFLKNGAIVHGDQLIERSKLRQTEIYCDMYKPNMMGIEVVMGACIIGELTSSDSSPVFLNFFRTSNADAFSRNDENLIRHLLPHIQRALGIHRKIVDEYQIRRLREQALEQLSTAILLIDAAGRIIFANRKAENLLRSSSSLTMQNGRLFCWDTRHNNAIKQALADAKNGKGSTVQLDNTLAINSCVATFSPLSLEKAHDLNTVANTMVMITEPNKPLHGDLAAFATLYRLSPAESRVLKQLLQQQSTLEIAESLQVSMSTLRTQMRALFAKTNTKNQRELIRFYLSHPMIG